MKAFQYYCERVNELSKAMNDELVAYVKSKGGLIRTDNTDDKDTIYGILMDFDLAENAEYPILAVAVFENDTLAILPDLTKGYTTIKDMADEELLELSEWHTIYGGYVLINATLYNLCESIEQYV